MYKDVARLIERCTICKAAKLTSRQRFGLLRTHLPSGTMTDGDVVSYDHIIMNPSSSKKGEAIAIAVVLDYFSGYAVVYPITNRKHDYLLLEFERNYLTLYGTPKLILADTELDSALWRGFSHLLRTRLNITTAYLSRTNPVERRNRDVNAMLRTFVMEKNETVATYLRELRNTTDANWSELLPYVQAALNDRPLSGLQVTPYEIKFGKPFVSPSDRLLLPDPPSMVPHASLTSYVEKKRKLVRAVQEFVSKFLTLRRTEAAANANAKRSVERIGVGDYVMREIRMGQHKMAPRAVGPYLVIAVLPSDHFRLRHVRDGTVVESSASQLAKHDPVPSEFRERLVSQPHIRLSQRQATHYDLTRNDVIIWRPKGLATLSPKTKRVSLVALSTSSRILVHELLDVRPRLAADLTVDLEDRKLAPGYKRFDAFGFTTIATWRPVANCQPLLYWLLPAEMIILAIMPYAELGEEGWSDAAKHRLRRL